MQHNITTGPASVEIGLDHRDNVAPSAGFRDRSFTKLRVRAEESAAP